jgi:acyl-CoA synthetase (AMP-forming)/AMP-acid ligase II
MSAHGGGFCPMYGATEATARMCYLPPELLPQHAGSVGGPIPGGQILIDDTDAAADAPGVGEVVYRGPNVMMGYATSRSDLVHGDTTGDELRTGDLGYLRDGQLYIAGRKDRQIKLYGKRIQLDELERSLSGTGSAVVVPAGTDRAVAFVEGAVESFHAAHRRTLQALEIPAECLTLRSVDQLPRLASGKPDLGTLRRLATGDGATVVHRPHTGAAVA